MKDDGAERVREVYLAFVRRPAARPAGARLFRHTTESLWRRRPSQRILRATDHSLPAQVADPVAGVADRHSPSEPTSRAAMSAGLIARRRPVEESGLPEDAQRVEEGGGQGRSQDGPHQPEEQRPRGGGDEDHQWVQPQ